MYRLVISFFSFLVFAITVSGCKNQSELHLYQFQGETMGTRYNIKVVFNQPKQSAFIDSLHQKVKNELAKIDGLMSTYKIDSEVSKFNALKAGGRISLSPESEEVLLYSKKAFNFTGGYFDITVGPLVDLWGFGAGSKSLSAYSPQKTEIDQVSSLVGVDHIEISGSALFKKAPVEIDLSAVAKGYAVDKAANELLSNGVNNYLVEVGGEIAGRGVNLQGNSWHLGIERPDFPGRVAYTTVNLSNMSLATSGDYRNFYVKEGRRFSHTIDPKTFYPVQHQLASVSVISDSCMEADALATALMAMGEKVGYEFATKNGINAFFIFRSGGDFASKSAHDFDDYLNLEE